MTGSDIQEAAETLRRHGKTFAFAARLLPEENRDTTKLLYAACREIDDLADQDGGPDAQKRLQRLLREPWRAADTDPLARRLSLLTTERGVSVCALLDLIRGALSDAEHVRIADRHELIGYAYHVAGSVGLMMSEVLGAADRRAQAHAIDLGIAMQLTNIARDVLEDARLGRRYLPGAWCPLEPAEILSGTPSVRADVSTQVLRLLELADAYYESARAGYAYLPLRSRLGVAVAARSYQAIGTRLRRWGGDVWRGRAATTFTQKLGHAATGTFIALSPRPETHDTRLHAPISVFLKPHQRGIRDDAHS